MDDVRIQTQRLVLRPVHTDDAASLARLIFGDPQVMAYSDGPVDVAQWIDLAEQSFREHGFGPLVVMESGSDQVLGYCGLFTRQINGQSEVEIGYRLSRQAHGNGFATEAVRAVLGYARDHHAQRVVAMIDPGNEASVRVAERTGFVREGQVMLEGYDHPDDLYVADLPPR